MPTTRSVLRLYCRYAYLAGIGDYWFEDPNESYLYKAYTLISFTLYTTMTFLENLAVFFGELPGVEKNSAYMFAAVHNLVLLKIGLIVYHKSSIRRLNMDMSVAGAELETRGTMRRMERKFRVSMLLNVISVYLALITYGIESARKMYIEGAPFNTVVTYLPKYDDLSISASFFRVFFYVTWLYMMLPMMSADCFSITHAIALSYKFTSLRQHFARMEGNFKLNVHVKGNHEAVRELKEDFLEGIRMHQKLLALARGLRRVFAVIMSLQVCETSAVAVLLLLRLVRSPNLYLTNAVMTYSFVGSLFLILALNLWNAGEVAYQSSLLPDAIYGCGWHRVKAAEAPELRRLVLLSCVLAQRPLVIKAFGVQDLSYDTFVSVVKMTYTAFAVLYDGRT